MPLAAAALVHVSTGTLLVTFGAGHVMSIQPLPEVPVCGVQVATGTFKWVSVGQVIVTNPLPPSPVCGTQVPDGVELAIVLQVVS